MRFVALMLCCLLNGCTSTRLGQDGWDEFEAPRTLEAPGPEGVRVFKERDVVGQLVRLQKPGDVAGWWEMEPKAHPEQWLHPLSPWESDYLQAMTSQSVPAAVRMKAPVNPGKLTPYENRRRIVAHYVWTHPATVKLQLGLYALARDSNPLHFALERGWQMSRGQEMFTEQAVSRLGAAAEFFAALAVGVAVDKTLGLARPSVMGSSAAPYLTPEVERAFTAAVRQRAAHMVEILSNNERGPVLTGVLDTRTGRTYWGINQKLPPDNLHPIIARRLKDYLGRTGGVTSPRAGVPGSHSEIVALNKALYEREAVMGRPLNSQDLSEFVLHNSSIRGTTKVEGIPPPCDNCREVLPPEIIILP